ncbi:MAG TPA: pitrilysin family protein, partial [Gemmatimonadaceae bacterium]
MFPTIDAASVMRTRLPNGLTVLIRQDRSAPVVAIVTYVCAGYFDETDDIIGIAHVLEHMYFKGTPSRGVGEIAKETKAVGGYLNAATIYDHTVYYTVLPSSGFVQGLDVQADAYARSMIDADELARELEVIIQEAKRKADNPGAVSTETLYEVLHDRHRIRRWRIGREPGLRALTRDQLVGFYRNFYHPGNTVLSIVGDVDPAQALAEVERKYGSLPAGQPSRHRGPTEEGSAGFRYREWAGDIGQTQLAIGWRTPGTTHPDTPALDMLATVLGGGRASRLYRAVRERRLASSVTAYNYTPTEIGVFVAHAETQPECAADAARAIWDQIRTIRDGDLGEFELERAKRIQESQWLRRLEDMEGQANYLAEWEALGDWRMGGRYLERMLTMTRADVVEAAVRHLDPDNASAVVYRPTSSTQIAASRDAMRTLLDREPRPPAL